MNKLIIINAMFSLKEMSFLCNNNVSSTNYKCL